MILADGYLEYGYQNFAGSCADDRVVVMIPVQKIEKVIYEEKITRLRICREMCSGYYDDYM